MTKLNDKKIRWIIRHYKKDFSGSSISRIHGITTKRIRQITKEYRDTGKIPKLKKLGRKPIPISEEETNLVLGCYNKYRCNAFDLERIIMRNKNKHIPHNRIHKIMLKHNIARRERNKQRRRKWVRYERQYSMELWHTDWKQLKDGKWLIAYEDDASRKMVSYGVFNEPTTKHSIEVLKQGIATHGIPDEILTDRGSQFYSNEGEKRKKGISGFERFLFDLRIKHILCRVNHPQTNGKLERFYGVVERKLPEFNNIDELMVWYNTIKPHRSLRFEWLETPSEAFVRKLPPHRIIGMVDWFGDNNGK